MVRRSRDAMASTPTTRPTPVKSKSPGQRRGFPIVWLVGTAALRRVTRLRAGSARQLVGDGGPARGATSYDAAFGETADAEMDAFGRDAARRALLDVEWE
jgi:hypothetical protein